MGVLKVLLFASFLCLATGENGEVPPGPPLTSTLLPPTNSTTASTTTTSTTSSTTSRTTSTSSTTTAKPTTKSTPITTSTIPTTTSTTAKPTTPKPSTHIGKWMLNYTNTDKPCLIFEGAIDINVTYKDGKVNKSVTVSVNSSAVATGQCVSEETLNLSWGVSNAISFNFTKTNDTKNYVINAINVTLNVSVPGEKNIRLFVLAHNEDEFTTPIANSYKCAKAKSLYLTSQTRSEEYFGMLHLSNLQMQAFRNSSSTKFNEAFDCDTYETPDVVPIAVGCALAALVVIVLIAYLIGRRRSQARGYLSM